MKKMTEKQKELIDCMSEFCKEKFQYTDKTTIEEASEYIDKNIEELAEWLSNIERG